MDLNKALKPLLDEGNLEKLQELVGFNLRPETIITELEQSKCFDMLPAFLPLLDLDRNKERCEDFARIYAKCLLAKDKKSVDALDKHLGTRLENKAIAFYYGQLTQDDLLVEWAKENYLNYAEYLEGIVSGDDAYLFENTSLRWNKESLQSLINTRLCKTAGRYCAKEMMDYFGYEKENVRQYIDGAHFDLTTVDFLFTQDIPFLRRVLKKHIHELIFLNWGLSESIITYMQTCLQKGWLNFSEQDWQDLANSNKQIYEQLQSDV